MRVFFIVCGRGAVMYLSAAIPGGRGVDPGDKRGNSAGFAGFCRQLMFGPGRGHWTAFALPRQDTRGRKDPRDL